MSDYFGLRTGDVRPDLLDPDTLAWSTAPVARPHLGGGALPGPDGRTVATVDTRACEWCGEVSGEVLARHVGARVWAHVGGSGTVDGVPLRHGWALLRACDCC